MGDGAAPKAHSWAVWQDPAVAARFLDARRGGLPGAHEQRDTLLRLVAEVAATPVDVLDLGCGDGILAETVVCARPVRRVVLLDGSAAMLDQARGTVASWPEEVAVSLVEADFGDPGWVECLGGGTFDVVVSGFAIHHSEDATKRRIYADVFSRLNPGGVFVHAEHVASANRLGEGLFERLQAEHIVSFRTSRGEAAAVEDVVRELRERPDRAANRLAPLESQLAWLREIGFVDVDCYWKRFELAVFGGFRR